MGIRKIHEEEVMAPGRIVESDRGSSKGGKGVKMEAAARESDKGGTKRMDEMQLNDSRCCSQTQECSFKDSSASIKPSRV